MSANTHPSRDAALRDGFDQLRHQRGVTVDEFSYTLNAMAHAMCPAKTADMPCIASFRTMGPEATKAINSWRRRVDRWVAGLEEGGTEMPAWLEEVWVAALEAHGDTQTRVLMARRHGFLGVRRPEAGDKPSCAFAAMGSVGQEVGDVMQVVSKMLANGTLDAEDRQYMKAAYTEIDDAIAALMGVRTLIEQNVEGKKPDLRLA